MDATSSHSRGLEQPYDDALAASAMQPTEPDLMENDAAILESILAYIDDQETSARLRTTSQDPSPVASSSTEGTSTPEVTSESHAGLYVLELDPELDDEELEGYIYSSGAQATLKEVRALSIY